jgi:hypothetical protein
MSLAAEIAAGTATGHPRPRRGDARPHGQPADAAGRLPRLFRAHRPETADGVRELATARCGMPSPVSALTRPDEIEECFPRRRRKL